MVRRNDTSWKASGACVGEPIEIFYEERYLDLAKTFCERCTVKTQCLKAGRKEEYGVWGGKKKGFLTDD